MSIALLTLAACGSSQPTPSATGGSTQSAAATDLQQFLKPPTTLPAWPAVTASIPKTVSVYFMSAGNPTADLISQGLKDATGVLGWTYHVVSFQITNPVTLNSGMVQAINAGANAIVFTGAPPQEIGEAITAAQGHHVALVEIGGAAETPQYIEIDNVIPSSAHWGKELAAAVVADAQKQNKIAHVAIISSASATGLKVTNDAFASAVTAYCPQCSTTSVDAPDLDLFTGQASKDVVSALQRNPNINYVEFSLGLQSVGVRAGLNGAGYNDVRLVGMIPSPAQLQELKSGASSAWVMFPNKLDGWMSADAIVRYVTGGDPTIHNNQVEPAWILETNSQFDPTTLPELPIDYSASFSKLWNLK